MRAKYSLSMDCVNATKKKPVIFKSIQVNYYDCKWFNDK